jgi:cell division protein FtsB
MMNLLEAYRDWRYRRREERIEDEERRHRHTMEQWHQPSINSQTIASHQRAIVALQKENQQLQQHISKLYSLIDEQDQSILALRYEVQQVLDR